MDLDRLLETDGSLYQIIIPEYDISFTFRLLTLKEYRVFCSLRGAELFHPFALADLVFDRCYLGNSILLADTLPAGITISIGNLILYLSGDSESETLKEDILRHRKQNPPDTILDFMRATIVKVFTYKLEDIDSWDREKLFKVFIISENILSKQDPQFERLNLKNIKSVSEMQTQQSANIDFDKENQAIRKAVGMWDIQDAESGKLTKGQLRQLSQKKGR